MKPETKKKLDRVFSEYIRRLAWTVSVLFKCFICGRPLTFLSSVAGHWRKRRHLGTRWHEKNAHAICPACNTRDESDPSWYLAAMIRAYTPDELQEIIDLSNKEVHFTESEGQEMIKKYQKLIKEL